MNETRATRYQRLRRRGSTAAAVSAGLMLAAVALTPLSHRLALWAIAAAGSAAEPVRTWLALALFVLCTVALWEIASLPAMLYFSLSLDRRYGSGTSSVEDVLAAQLQATAVALPAAFAAGFVVALSVRLAAPVWWLAAGAMWSVLSALALRGAPALVARVAGARRIERPSLARRIEDLARRARVPISSIAQWQPGPSAPSSAFVTGAGRDRRVFVSAELVDDWSDDEIAVVVAHELAHHVYRDLWRTLALDGTIVVAGLLCADLLIRFGGGMLGFRDAGDLAALPIVALVAALVWVAATPLRHAQSRRQERRADVFALAMTGGADAFGAAVRRLGARHLSEERPSAVTRWLFHSHPSVGERLALAASFARVRDYVDERERT